MYVEDALSALVDLLVAPQDKLTRRVYNVQSISPTAGEIAAAIGARLPEARLSFEPTEADVVERWPQMLVDQSARRDWGWNPQFDLNRLADCFLEELRRELPHAR
jgi:threonine 3-dehydrogenase